MKAFDVCTLLTVVAAEIDAKSQPGVLQSSGACRVGRDERSGIQPGEQPVLSIEAVSRSRSVYAVFHDRLESYPAGVAALVVADLRAGLLICRVVVVVAA